ncbi:hypothetical protein [Nocardioides sp. SYSU D00038]|uniref:maltokinase N-terminal cap-like domain-containing protein n=1 Tax=Nocardioides sp. SYSU D00038 TaxID=2812554 RepID=UPI00196865EB|nr:hypothetical protein [Nocardioides sp. SYSU D00038]
MALLHQATLTPTKRDLLDAWLPRQSWWDGGTDRDPVASFRLDDPAGEVGIELFLLGSSGGSTLFVPLAYRAVPLDGAEAHLVGVTEHSVLGTRHVYDGCADPVVVAALATTVLSGGTEALEEVEGPDGRVLREPAVRARGTGSAQAEVAPDESVTARDEGDLTVVGMAGHEVVVARRVGAEVVAAETLRVTGAGLSDAVVAGVRPI